MRRFSVFLSVLSIGLCAVSAARTDMPSRTLVTESRPAFQFRGAALGAKRIALPVQVVDKVDAAGKRAAGRMKIGIPRSIPADQQRIEWQALPAGGYVARFAISSPGAEALRARITLPAEILAADFRATGSDGVVEGFAQHETGLRGEFWMPITEGAVQTVEVYSAGKPSAPLMVSEVAHIYASPFAAKVANPCSPDAACASGSTARDTALAERRKSVAQMTFQSADGSYVCTGTLLNSERAPEPLFLTANHCISTAAEAASLVTRWFYERTCAGVPTTTSERRSGGASIVFSNPTVDSTLLRLNETPPNGTVFSAWDARPMSGGDSMVALSHPTGDYMKYGLGTVDGLARYTGVSGSEALYYPYDMYDVTFSRGLTEGGSSGSGIFSLAGSSLVLRGVLSVGSAPSSIPNCEATGASGGYSRFEVFQPMISQYLSVNPPTRTDDYPNRITEAPEITAGARLTGAINYAGDVDVFKVVLPRAGVLVARTVGANIDTVGALLNSAGTALVAEDDAEAGNNHFGVTWRVPAGTYYVLVGHWEPDGTGTYAVETQFYSVDSDNYTDIWWTEGESGWGLTLNHQSNTLFGALYTYDTDGSPLWLVMSNGTLQTDGTYSGALFRFTGPVFSASPWGAVTGTQVGTMQLRFSGNSSATLTYSVNGVNVTKAITRFLYSSATRCLFSYTDRSYTSSLQDLWWTNGQNGWGLNLVLQGSTLFGALYSYGSDGKPLWLVMSNGVQGSDGTYTGDLFRFRGPAFNTAPWTAVTPTRVGTMTVTRDQQSQRTATLRYTVDGVTVTKAIERFTFAELRPDCERAR
jgi:hypothetical protein